MVGALEMARATGFDPGKVGMEFDGEVGIGVRNGDEMGSDFDVDPHFLLQLAGNALPH